MTKQYDRATPMTKTDAARIQSHADRADRNHDFAGRAQSAADRQAHEQPAQVPTVEPTAPRRR